MLQSRLCCRVPCLLILLITQCTHPTHSRGSPVISRVSRVQTHSLNMLPAIWGESRAGFFSLLFILTLANHPGRMVAAHEIASLPLLPSNRGGAVPGGSFGSTEGSRGFPWPGAPTLTSESRREAKEGLWPPYALQTSG